MRGPSQQKADRLRPAYDASVLGSDRNVGGIDSRLAADPCCDELADALQCLFEVGQRICIGNS